MLVLKYIPNFYLQTHEDLSSVQSNIFLGKYVGTELYSADDNENLDNENLDNREYNGNMFYYFQESEVNFYSRLNDIKNSILRECIVIISILKIILTSLYLLFPENIISSSIMSDIIFSYTVILVYSHFAFIMNKKRLLKIVGKEKMDSLVYEIALNLASVNNSKNEESKKKLTITNSNVNVNLNHNDRFDQI